MATFKKKPAATPPKDVAVDLAALAETIEPASEARAPIHPTPAPPAAAAPVRRGKGRPPSPQPRTVFGTRLKPETVSDIEALRAGLRLKMQGEAIERAVAFYRQYILTKTKRELGLSPETKDEDVLSKAFKADD